MAGRRSGPPPADNPARRNADPLVTRDGWTQLENKPNTGKIPPIPDWVNCSPGARAVYAELGKLPQARLWGPGTWFELHLTLPLLSSYLVRPGSEGFKAIISTLGSGLALTELDMQRARINIEQPKTAAQKQAQAAQVKADDDLAARRRRVNGAA